MAAASEALSRELTTASHARRFVATTLGSWEEPHLTDTIQLLMSELVTNVLVHTTSTPAVRITLLRNHVHVEVIEAADGAVMSMLRAADRGQLDVRTDQQRAA